MAPSLHDAETQVVEIELEQILTRPASLVPQHLPEPAELDSVPLITRSSLGSSQWAQNRCARRIGLNENDIEIMLFFLRTSARIQDDPFNQELVKLESQIQTLANYIKYLEDMRDTISNTLREAKWWKLGSRNRMKFLKVRRKWLQAMLECLHLVAWRTRAELASLQTKQSLEPSNVTAVDGSSPLPPGIRDTSAEATHEGESRIEAARDSRLPKPSSERQSRANDIINDPLPPLETKTRYIVVGWFSGGSTDPKEKILQFDNEDAVFKELRRCRGWHEYISLKSLSGFGLYMCDITHGAHTQVPLSPQNENTIVSLYRAYRASKYHHDPDVAKEWTRWIEKNFNNGNNRPLEGNYSLELKYRWSATRLTIAVVIPVSFSLAVGLGYMIKTGDVSTAWTISIYIMTTAGAIVALLAVLGNTKG